MLTFRTQNYFIYFLQQQSRSHIKLLHRRATVTSTGHQRPVAHQPFVAPSGLYSYELWITFKLVFDGRSWAFGQVVSNWPIFSHPSGDILGPHTSVTLSTCCCFPLGNKAPGASESHSFILNQSIIISYNKMQFIICLSRENMSYRFIQIWVGEVTRPKP